jgi:hypothetical protein
MIRPAALLLLPLFLAVGTFRALSEDSTILAATPAGPELRTLTNADKHLSVKIPATWTVRKGDNSPFVLIVRNPDFGGLTVMVQEGAGTSTVESPAFAADAKAALQDNGGEFVSESRESFQGRTTYTCLSRRILSGHIVYYRSVSFVAGSGHCYTLTLFKPGADPITDPALKAILDSFTFIPDL